MNVSYRWLKTLAPTIEESAEALAERLTFTAVPVEDLTWLGEGLEELVVGRVMRITEHPRADRLVICQVEIGRDQHAQVVTGAPVVVEGGFYPFVAAGQKLPDGRLIKRVKLRGESSEGMLCSERELGVGRDQSGIMRLVGEFAPGQSVLEALELDDHRLELEVTPNRPDLLGHRGVAREAAPGGESDLLLPAFPAHLCADCELRSANEEAETAGVRVRIEEPDGCPRYLGAVIRGVTIGPSPTWLANRLRAVGMQPINNVVDATNYVLCELNQPLHAFDLAKLRGPAVVIRRARDGEALRTLDGKVRTLTSEVLVIADSELPCALAGVMGGEESEVTGETRDIFLECAYFDPRRVRTACKALGIDTEASYRFQRGIDPTGQPEALQRVLDLLLTVAGGELQGDPIDVNPSLARPRSARLRRRRVRQVLGVDLGDADLERCLRPLGFDLKTRGDEGLEVAIPPWRPDVDREVDLIEEVARRHGYGNFPEEMRPFRPTVVPEDEYVGVMARIRERLVGLGFLEAMTSPFAPATEGDVKLLNPLSEREDHLRRDLLTGLVHRVEHNLARGVRDMRLFEIGTAFQGTDSAIPAESIRLAAVWTGERTPPHWSDESRDWDVWDLKWMTEAIVEVASPGARVRPVEDGESLPGSFEDKLAVVTGDGEVRGWAGRMPAEALEAPRWAGPLWGVEVHVEPRGRPEVSYRALPTYPAVERDLALLVPREVTAAEVDETIRGTSLDGLERLEVFDVYEGGSVPEGTRSIAWRLRFRSPDRTLTDEEVDDAVRRITAALEEKLNVRIRGA